MATPETKKSAHKSPWRDNIEAFVVAVVMAVMLKYYVLEAYKIPTGSMQPTLMGNQETQIFDRVLVDKLSYRFRDPERWEVATFKYPLDRSKNFIKRIVGMPGEWLRIAYGDLWTSTDQGANWKILRRPRPVQRETWKQLDWSVASGSPTWAGESRAASAWKFTHRAVLAAGDGRARFVGRAGSIMDMYTDGYPLSMQGPIASDRNTPPPTQHVGDLRVEGSVRAEAGCTSVAVEFNEGSRRYVLEIPGPAAPADATLHITAVDAGIEPLARVARDQRGKAYRLPAGKLVSFGAQNLDDELSLDIEGEVAMALEIELAGDQTSAVFLTCQGSGAAFTDLQVYRDIYYREGTTESQFAIPEGHYFMMGDNTQNSSDGREWKLYVTAVDENGKTRTIRGNERMEQFGSERHSSADGWNPVVAQTDAGSTMWIRDEWGELSMIPFANTRRLPSERAPFVPRNLMTGRALLVFWPFSYEYGVMRLKWVH